PQRRPAGVQPAPDQRTGAACRGSCATAVVSHLIKLVARVYSKRMTVAGERVPTSGIRQSLPGLLSLALASCLAVTTEMLPVGLLPDIGAAFAVPDSVTGLLVGLYAVMVAVLAVPLTAVTSRFARK